MHVTQHQDHRRVQDVADEDADVQPHVANLVDDSSGDDRAERVRERVGDVRNGVHAAVHGHVAYVDEVAEGRQDGRVDERDAETVDHDGDDDAEVGGTEGEDEAADALQTQPDDDDEPVVGGVEPEQLDGEEDADDVREEGGKPDHPDGPLGGVERRLHPHGDGRFEEGERYVGHDEAPGAHGYVRVEDQLVDRCPLQGRVLVPHALASAGRFHREDDQQPVD